MTLQEANNFFKCLMTNATKKSEITVYEKFIHILTELKNREFSIDQIHTIEKELDSLNLKSIGKNRKKHLKKALAHFEKFLKDSFSLTSKGYYAKLASGLGLSFGILFGTVLLSSWERSLGISMGLIFGMLVGYIIGSSMDNRAKAEGNML
jgi:hypothetical protein